MSIYQIECRKYLSKNKGFAIIYIQLFFFPESNFTIHFSLLCFSPLIFEQYRIKIRKKKYITNGAITPTWEKKK